MAEAGASSWPFDPGRERYVSLATFRRNGQEVRTPVWIARAGDGFFVYTEDGSGKVKRIRANAAVRVAACTLRGTPTSAWMEARARIVSDPQRVAAAYAELRRKYGWQMWVADVLSRLTGRFRKRAMLELFALRPVGD